MGELRYLKQIIGDSSHDLTNLGIVIVSIRQAHQMVIGIPAHIRLHSGAHDMSGSRHIIAAQAVDNPQQQIQQTHPQNDFQGKAPGIYQRHIGDITQDHG